MLQSTNRLRKEIQNICDSYSHPWDILAELCQNSVDAICRYNSTFGETATKQHTIRIAINSKERSLVIYDTGIGFQPDKFAELLAPHGTDKPGFGELIGEKGVGLTYTIFAADHYYMRTQSTQAYIEGHIENAVSWRTGRIEQIPLFVPVKWETNSVNPQDTYTEILLKGVEKQYEEQEDLFNQNINTLEFLIRTKTAIGYLKQVFGGKTLNVEVDLALVDIYGKGHNVDIKPNFMLPHEFVGSNAVELDAFKKRAATLDDRQKANQLQGKALMKIGSETRAGRRVNYYAFMAPSRLLWKDISEKDSIYYVNEEGEHNYLYGGGIYVASRGMPTGIRLEPPATGYAGYWPNFFIILEDDSIVFDLGRKSVPGRTQGLLKEIARKLFNEFSPYFQYISSDPAVTSGASATVQQYEKSKVFESLKNLADLGLGSISYLKHPDRQEGAVVALFHELLGAKVLKGYFPLKTGYRQTYDLWANYKITKDLIGSKLSNIADSYGNIELPIVIEFKFQAEDILRDFEKDIKYFTDIDLIVCWDLDESRLARQNIKAELIQSQDVLFVRSNYKLIWPGAYNLGTASEKPVISLRKFIQDQLSS